MLLLKLLIPIALGLLIILKILLEKGWSHPLVTKYERFLVYLPKAMMSLIALTIILILIGHFTFRSLASEVETIHAAKEKELGFLKKDFDLSLKLTKERDSMALTSLKQLKKTIAVYAQIAKKNYPQLDSTSALNKLTEQMRTENQLKTSGIFKPFSKHRKEAITEKLREVRKAQKWLPKIKFHVDQNTPKNDTIIGGLVTMLTDAGFLAKFESGTFPRNDIARSWEIHTYSKYAKLIQQILHDIKPYVNPNYALARRDVEEWKKLLGVFPENEVHFYIYESPNFNNDGQVTY